MKKNDQPLKINTGFEELIKIAVQRDKKDGKKKTAKKKTKTVKKP